MLPEYNGFWKNNYKWGDDYPASTVGGGLCVFLKNTGASSVGITDMR